MKIRLTFTNVTPITEVDIELPDCAELTDILEIDHKKMKEDYPDIRPFDVALMLDGKEAMEIIKKIWY